MSMLSIPCWLASSLTRLFPASPVGGAQTLALLAARGERTSFQACLRNPTISALKARIVVSAPDDVRITVRRVGYVPMLHHNTETEAAELDGVGHIPGMVPDPLFPEDTIMLGPWESHAFWVTVQVPADVAPGTREISVRLVVQDEALPPLSVHLDVCPLVAQPPRAFPVTHWFYADALCDWYKVAPFEEPFWAIVRAYMQDMVDHGGNSLYVPLFTPPTDGIKRPTQLLRVTTPMPGQYQFDFRDVQRWVRLARECGARYFEWTHLFSQWGVKYALRVYRSNADPTSLLWPPDTGATSDTYRAFLAQFMPQFHAFLQAEGLLDCSLFHLSDEPHGDEHLQAYKQARALLRELAPWMKVADAMSDIRYGREGMTDIPIPSIRVAHEYREAGIPSWVYWCCGPRGPYVQRLMDTPLPKMRMAGWLFYRLGAQGFLHWGYNYWYKSQTQQLIDPFTVQDGLRWPGWAYGDTFEVYPGADGPIDSLRWEVWAESLQDYGLLESAGIHPDDPLLADIQSYADFPKSEAWIQAARRRILLGS
jgi:hypothetical protein